MENLDPKELPSGERAETETEAKSSNSEILWEGGSGTKN
jgi:hypothetical protein